MGLYKDPIQRYGYLDMQMVRALRLVVDTGLHSKDWTREQAVQYITDHSATSKAKAQDAVDRYISWPGQATAYMIGEIFIKKLRARAERAVGKRFDVREFHDQILDTGALPLSVLESKVNAWIAHRKRGAG